MFSGLGAARKIFVPAIRYKSISPSLCLSLSHSLYIYKYIYYVTVKTTWSASARSVKIEKRVFNTKRVRSDGGIECLCVREKKERPRERTASKSVGFFFLLFYYLLIRGGVGPGPVRFGFRFGPAAMRVQMRPAWRIITHSCRYKMKFKHIQCTFSMIRLCTHKYTNTHTCTYVLACTRI